MQDRAFYERIGAKFQSERERQKITREHMAEQINISSKFLYEIESGRKGFSCEIFRNMCKYLHVNADYILEEDDVASSQMRIETMTRDFSIEEMNYLVKMIEGIREMRKAYEQNDKIGCKIFICTGCPCAGSFVFVYPKAGKDSHDWRTDR